jgi:lysophospholipase L1-like esterase
MLVYLRERGLAFQPNIVVVGDANLWTQFFESNDPTFVEKFMWRGRLKNLLRRSALYHYIIEVRLKNFYERHRTKFIPIDPKQDSLFREQQKRDPDNFFRDAIAGICQLARTNGVQPVLLFLPTLTDLEAGSTSSVLRVKQEISHRLDVPLVDTTAVLTAQAKQLYLEADPVHLNAPGNELVGRQLAEALRPLVKP